MNDNVIYLVWGYDTFTDSHRLITVTNNLINAKEAKKQAKDMFERIYCEAIHSGDLVGEVEVLR